MYGGAIWLGPLFLLLSVLFYLWHHNTPLTRWGARRIARRLEESHRRFEEARARREAETDEDG